jgi:hypothetical protein
MPRLATPGGPVRAGGLGALGTATGVGAAAATATGLGARGTDDVEPDGSRQLGDLEQRSMDADLTSPRARSWPRIATLGESPQG